MILYLYSTLSIRGKSTMNTNWLSFWELKFVPDKSIFLEACYLTEEKQSKIKWFLFILSIIFKFVTKIFCSLHLFRCVKKTALVNSTHTL